MAADAIAFFAMISPVVLLGALPVVFAFGTQARPGGAGARALLQLLFGVAVCGLAGGLLGACLGILAFCVLTFTQSAQCGLAGIFIAGPAGFTASAAAYMYVWFKGGLRNVFPSRAP